MNIPENRFKRAIAVGRQQIGLWCSLPSAFAAEIVAPAGFDWLLFDTEHSPAACPTVLSQLQAVAPYDVSPAVRAATNDTVLIKRLLDIGAQTLALALRPIGRGGAAGRVLHALSARGHGGQG